MGIMYIKRNGARHKMKNIMFKEVFIAGMQGFFSYHKKKKVTHRLTDQRKINKLNVSIDTKKAFKNVQQKHIEK